MAEEPKKALNVLDSSAADILLGAVSLVGENSRIIILLKNDDDDDFYIQANMGPKDVYWVLSQAKHVVLDESLGDTENEEDDDAS